MFERVRVFNTVTNNKSSSEVLLLKKQVLTYTYTQRMNVVFSHLFINNT